MRSIRTTLAALAALRLWSPSRPPSAHGGAGRALSSSPAPSTGRRPPTARSKRRASASTRRPAASSSSTKRTRPCSSSTKPATRSTSPRRARPKLPVARRRNRGRQQRRADPGQLLHPASGASRSRASLPSGAKLAGWPVAQESELGQLYSVAVDPGGDVWLGYYGGIRTRAQEVRPNGTPTGQTIHLVGAKYGTFCDFCQTFAFDSHKNVWYTVEDGSLIRLDASDNYDPDKRHNVKGQLSPVARDVAIDPSTDDAFWNHGDRIEATRYTDPLRRPGRRSNTSRDSNSACDGLLRRRADHVRDRRHEGQHLQAAASRSPGIHWAAPDFTKVKSAERRRLRARRHRRRRSGHVPLRVRPGHQLRKPLSGQQRVPAPSHDFRPTRPSPGCSPGWSRTPSTTSATWSRNAAGTGYSDDALIKTLPQGLSDKPDPCENALARKQTGSQTAPRLPRL